MKQQNFYKYFLILAAVLLAIFLIRTILDLFVLKSGFTTELIFDRTIDYLLPSAILFAFGMYYKKK